MATWRVLDAASWLKLPHARIVSVTSRNRSSAQRLAERFQLDCHVGDNYQAVLENPHVDIVNISGPNHVHAEQGIAAARAGKHLMMEKPVCLTAAENQALRQAVAEAGVKSVVSFVLRWNPLFQNLKSLLDRNAIGRLFFIEVDYWHGISGWYRGLPWVQKKNTGGSTMLFGGCHAIDAMRYFAGQEVIEVTAYANNVRGNFEYDSNVVAILKFASGAIGKTSTLFDAEMPYTFNIDLAGTDGTLRDNRIWSKTLFPGQRGWTTMETVLPDSAAVDHHPFDAQMAHLVDCIREDRESPCNIADAYHTHQVCLAIDQSLVTGKPVALNLGEPTTFGAL